MANATTAIKQGLGANNLMNSDSQSFVLASSEFVAVQVYVEQGSLLPKTKEEFETKLGVEASTIDQFQPLINIYSQIVTHCSFFKGDTFPATVSLASDVVNYNIKVPVYYGAINPLLDILLEPTKSDEDKTKAETKLKAIIKNLRDTAQGYANNASTVKQKIHDFVEQTKQDQSTLQPLSKSYHDKYGSLDGKKGLIQDYLQQAENANREIQHYQVEYEYDVKVAGTTPTYAWVLPPFGLIAAATVAGVYGKRATDALDKVHEYQERLQTAEENLRNALNLLHNLQLADDSIDNLLSKLQAALPALEKMEGFWGAFANDLAAIIDVIDRDIDQAPVIIKDLGVDTAINSWAKAAAAADKYRQNAYVTVKTEAEIKANPGLYALSKAA